MGTAVEFENERVRVLRVTHASREAHPRASRHDRIIIYLSDGLVVRTEGNTREEIRRAAGEVVWRNRSEHNVENLQSTNHEVIIVELKQ